ncbi:NAD-dependent epimerase/dehydratase family protein [Candidatus Venteria ishoeyi]|uniref:dTDP-6-deoxy-L-talose 4-dehydrogenase (NAD(+)) n=1 Tax=Candidatus Venteria ishoeyi TaxID=1899563 RepID=A0A1H6F3M6_9GAMM|nr:NAD(P)-dependent oxidoreductase [Candidatus Venteria ishoeyi]SEH04193.1 dTDP-6-deoxy-L-talose 4-dehydrogenase (NAD(+)) [Candidatus Venteria ishoeyi]
MKIAIIGASGFIGRHLVPFLLDTNLELILAARNIHKLANDSLQYQCVEFDLQHTDNAYQRLGEPDILLDLAWGHLSNYRSLHHIEVELPAHYRFIKHMVAAGVQSIVVTGTCFEYGMQEGVLTENLHTQPDNPYGYAKDALYKQLAFLKQKYDFKLTWLRLFYLHGQDQAPNTLYSQLRKVEAEKQAVFNMSGGEQLRDYLAVDEAAQYISQLIGKNKDMGIVNICSGQPVSVRRLVETWLVENNWDIRLNLGYYPYPDYEPMAFWGCAKKMRGILNG